MGVVSVDSAEFNCISLFSGGGGLDMGVELALGIGSCRVLAYVEREAYACEVLASRMEKGDVDPAPIWTDVTTFDARPFRGLVDIVSGGFPCQDISVAGKRAGITGSRSGLWKQYLRIVGECQPQLVCIENVAALRTSGLEVVLTDLASLGYDAEWGTLRASDVGATHHRDRMFILAHHHHGGFGGVGQFGLREDERINGEAAFGGDDSDGQSGASLADDDGGGRGQIRGESEPELAGCKESASSSPGSEQLVADTNCSRLKRYGGSDRIQEKVAGAHGYSFKWPPGPEDAAWCAVVAERPDLEPSVCRVADGLAYRVDRLRLTGNGVVPAQAAHAFRELLRRALTTLPPINRGAL